MPAFVDTTVKDIDERLRELQDEVARLEAARSALTDGRRRPGRPRGTSARTTRARTGRRTVTRQAARPTRRGGNTRAAQTLELVSKQPGVTIPELAKAMGIQPNYLYRVLPRLASGGQVRRDGQGWHPASTSTRANSTGNVTGRRQGRTAKPTPTASATRAARARRGAGSTSTTNGRTSPGATKASVLAALAGGESMTAGQVAAKAGLARPTVSTTLSNLAKSGEVEKAKRGYQLASAS